MQALPYAGYVCYLGGFLHSASRRLSLFVVILASQGNDSNKVIDRYENIDIIVLIETVNKESLHP